MAIRVPSEPSARAPDDSEDPARPTQGADGCTESAEGIRRSFAEGWGEMAAAWGVQPSVARVHGYLLAHGGTLTEREVREALGLSHRAASLALAETEAWGLVERVPQADRAGRRGPSPAAYSVVRDHWRWFQRIAEQRKQREADPLVPKLEESLARAQQAVRTTPDDPELARLRDWLTELLGFMRLFDRAVGVVARAETEEIARGFAVLGQLSDESLDRLLRLFGSLPEKELASTIEAVSHVSPSVARRILAVAGRIARLRR
jgi:DNA-binding transcriptional regulator GbsR (MarR family)